MLRMFPATIIIFILLALAADARPTPSHPIVDTGQHTCFNNRKAAACPQKGRDFFGQDAQYQGNEPSYTNNGDGTITDNVTGLMWVKARGRKTTWKEAVSGASKCRVGGHDDWRAPTIKELYSLIDFRGDTGRNGQNGRPYIDTRFFDFKFGDTSRGERSIDCQDWSATKYVGTTMGGNETAFGVNFADGRIKAYPTTTRRPGRRDKRYIRYVRGNPAYGQNRFRDNGDGAVTDEATGLTWQKGDSGRGLNWKEALAYAENLTLAGRSDWRLPNAKELQSIVDYSRSPSTTHSPAIAPVFDSTSVESYYWTSTTHTEHGRADRAVYIAFGRAMGHFQTPGSKSKKLIDVHGAGAQRSDPKSGDPSRFPQGMGPQGDDISIYNFVRCVRGGKADPATPPPPSAFSTTSRMRGPKPPLEEEINGQPGGMGPRPGPEGGFGMAPPPPGGGQEGRMGMRQGPPPEAFDACSGAAAGSPCSFTAPHGRISGICRAPHGDLICVPEGRRGGPPPQ